MGWILFFALVVAVIVYFWIRHRTLSGVVRDLGDVKDDVQNLKAKVSPPITDEPGKSA